jgi:hypothetical protein
VHYLDKRELYPIILITIFSGIWIFILVWMFPWKEIQAKKLQLSLLEKIASIYVLGSFVLFFLGSVGYFLSSGGNFWMIFRYENPIRAILDSLFMIFGSAALVNIFIFPFAGLGLSFAANIQGIRSTKPTRLMDGRVLIILSIMLILANFIVLVLMGIYNLH